MGPSHDTAIIVIALLSGTGLIATLAGFVLAWLREGRARAWAQADAEKLAAKLVADQKVLSDKVTADAKEMAEKLKADTLALAAQNLNTAAQVSKKLIDDAAQVATKLHDNAEKLAAKVAENTTISTDAVKGAKEAFTEANTVNAKIKELQEALKDQGGHLIAIGEHIKKTDDLSAKAEQALHEEALFTQRVKDGIEAYIKSMNGRAEKFRTKKQAK